MEKPVWLLHTCSCIFLGSWLATVLIAGAQTATDTRVTVTVTDPSGAPIPGAHIAAFTDLKVSKAEVQAGQDGKATLELAAGSYELVAKMQAFVTVRQQINVDGRANSSYTIALNVCCSGPVVTVATTAGNLELWSPPLDDVWVPIETIETLPTAPGVRNIGSREHSINFNASA